MQKLLGIEECERMWEFRGKTRCIYYTAKIKFLNFFLYREFYYIQMEKYARQAIAEGIKNPEDIIVTTDSELYRVLNLHYNRNNQIEVLSYFFSLTKNIIYRKIQVLWKSKNKTMWIKGKLLWHKLRNMRKTRQGYWRK